MGSRLPTTLQSFLKYKIFIFLQKLSDMKFLVLIFFTVVFWSACSGSLTPEEQKRNRFVEDIGLLLQYLEAGKSPEELIREFESEALGEQ